jgi:hypothetical protein
MGSLAMLLVPLFRCRQSVIFEEKREGKERYFSQVADGRLRRVQSTPIRVLVGS